MSQLSFTVSKHPRQSIYKDKGVFWLMAEETEVYGFDIVVLGL